MGDTTVVCVRLEFLSRDFASITVSSLRIATDYIRPIEHHPTQMSNFEESEAPTTRESTVRIERMGDLNVVALSLL